MFKKSEVDEAIASTAKGAREAVCQNMDLGGTCELAGGCPEEEPECECAMEGWIRDEIIAVLEPMITKLQEDAIINHVLTMSFLKQQIKKAVKRQGIESWGSNGIDLSTPTGLMKILDVLDREDDPEV